MASIFKAKYYVNEQGRQCRKGTPGAKRVTAERYTIKLKFGGKVHRVKGFTDKAATEQRAAELLRRLERGEVGLADPFAKAKATPLSAHLAEYIQSLRSAGRDAEHISITEKRLTKLFKACGWTRLQDIDAKGFEAWRLEQQAPKAEGGSGIGPRTVNQYLEHARAFLRWSIQRDKWGTDPLAKVVKLNEAEDVRRRRRALSPDEVASLLRMAGPRKVVYLMALTTGLRRSELAGLRWADVHLDASRPYVMARASTTKNGKDASVPLVAELTAALRAILPDPVSPDARVFKVPSVEVFRSDLRKAGIPVKDALGRAVDFHALRHTVATGMARAGVPQRIAQGVMRHSDPKLTNKTYTDESLLPLADAVARLPWAGHGVQLRPSSDLSGCALVHSGAQALTIRISGSVQNPRESAGVLSISSGNLVGGKNAPARART